MRHSIRINGEVKTVDCELGSGVLDKNGVEIFEGDKVEFVQFKERIYATVCFDNGAFYLYWKASEDILGNKKIHRYRLLGATPPQKGFEVVGHIAQD